VSNNQNVAIQYKIRASVLRRDNISNNKKKHTMHSLLHGIKDDELFVEWVLTDCYATVCKRIVEWGNIMEMEGTASASLIVPSNSLSILRKKALHKKKNYWLIVLWEILFEIFPIKFYSHSIDIWTYSVDLSCYMSRLSFCYMPYAPSFYGRFYDLTTHISTVIPHVQIRKITTKMQVCCWPLSMSS
jgi:hypothetical protein